MDSCAVNHSMMLWLVCFVMELIGASAVQLPALHVKDGGDPASKVYLTDIFLFGGQSNSIGAGHWKELSPERLRTPQNMLAMDTDYGNEFIPYDVGSNQFGSVVDRFGPEVGFGEAIARQLYPHENFGILKVAKGGTSLRDDWVLNGELFKSLVSRAKAAKRSPQCENKVCKIKALIWTQGEQDAADGATSQEYEANLERLVTTLRSELSEPDMFVIIAGLPADGEVSTLPGADGVRRAQKAFVTEQGSSHATFVSANGVSRFVTDPSKPGWDGSALHYDTEGLFTLGQRVGMAYEEALKAM